MLKKLFKRRPSLVVYKDGKAYRVKTIAEAYARMTR
jgi:hypothetical protein